MYVRGSTVRSSMAFRASVLRYLDPVRPALLLLRNQVRACLPYARLNFKYSTWSGSSQQGVGHAWQADSARAPAADDPDSPRVLV